jgi:hypothetical protein
MHTTPRAYRHIATSVVKSMRLRRWAVIPPKSNRKVQRDYDKNRYKQRLSLAVMRIDGLEAVGLNRLRICGTFSLLAKFCAS